MPEEAITIPLDAKTAKMFRSATTEEQRKIAALVSLWLRELTSTSIPSLKQTLDDAGQAVQARGITPEKLDSLFPIAEVRLRSKKLRMHNPAHPGEVLREHIGDMPIGKFARHLGVSRFALSRLLNGKSGVSAEMALKLSEAFGTSPELWLNMQTQYDLWRAVRHRRKRVPRLAA